MEAMLIGQGVQAAAGGIMGGRQLYRANQLKKELEREGRPEMRATVDSLGELIQFRESIVEEARQLAREGLPEESFVMAQKGIDRAGANAMRESSSRRGGLSTIGGISQMESDATLQLASMDAQARINQQQNVFSELNNLAQTKQLLASALGEQEQFNKLMPYMEKREEMQALLGAGIQNVVGMGQGAAIPAYFGSQNPSTKKTTGGGGTGSKTGGGDYNNSEIYDMIDFGNYG